MSIRFRERLLGGARRNQLGVPIDLVNRSTHGPGPSGRRILRWCVVAGVVAAASVAAIIPDVPSAEAKADPTPTSTLAVPAVPGTTPAVADTETDPPPADPVPVPPSAVPVPPPSTPAAPVPPAATPADGCPTHKSGHWVGVWNSAGTPFVDGTTDQHITISGNAISGTVTITNSIYSGGEVVGVVDCDHISFGFVIGVATFDGTINPDGLTATGNYTAPAIDDHGIWSAIYVPEASTPDAPVPGAGHQSEVTSPAQPATGPAGGASSDVPEVSDWQGPTTGPSTNVELVPPAVESNALQTP